MELKYAQDLAVELCYRLQPYTEKINIAGSVRRRKPEVKDIEIICLPKVEILKDMFGWDEGVIRSVNFYQTVMSLGQVMKGNTDGKYMQIKLAPVEIMLDLFMPEPKDYFRQYAIRTGPAEYSHKEIAGAWRKLGWVGSDKGLRRMDDCVEVSSGESTRWICRNPDGEKPPAWQDEKEFYKWLRIPYLEPTRRI